MKDCKIICGQVKNFKIVHAFQTDRYLCHSPSRMELEPSAISPIATPSQKGYYNRVPPITYRL